MHRSETEIVKKDANETERLRIERKGDNFNDRRSVRMCMNEFAKELECKLKRWKNIGKEYEH